MQMWFQVKAVKEENQISGQSGRAEREGVKGTAPPYICPYSVVGKMGVNDQAYKVMMADSLGHSFDGISMVNKIKYLLYRQENIFFLAGPSRARKIDWSSQLEHRTRFIFCPLTEPVMDYWNPAKSLQPAPVI